MDEKNRIENRIGVLDGIRALAIGMVVWFHFWQQTVSSDSNRVHKIYWTHRDQPCRMGQVWIYFCGYDDLAQRILQFLSLCKIYCSGRGLAGYEDILQKEGSKNTAFLLFYVGDRSVFLYFTGT